MGRAAYAWGFLMVILVTTTGPSETGGPLYPITTPSFSNLLTQIADEIDDTTGEYQGQIQTAIYGAIRFCERNTYYFNETRDVTFSTVAGQAFYGAADEPHIATLIRIQHAYIEENGQNLELIRATPDYLEVIDDTLSSQSKPVLYTYINQALRLYPVPNAVYTIRLQLGPYRLAPIEDSADSNAWTTEAFDLIKARAKYLLYKDILKDPNFAAEALNDYNEQHAALKGETSDRHRTGVIKATCF